MKGIITICRVLLWAFVANMCLYTVYGGKAFDDAVLVKYGVDANDGVTPVAWPDWRHARSYDKQNPTTRHKVVVGSTARVLYADVTSPSLGRLLLQEPCIRLDHRVNTNVTVSGETATTNYTYTTDALTGYGLQVDSAIYSFVLRLRPDWGADWILNGRGSGSSSWERMFEAGSVWKTSKTESRGFVLGVEIMDDAATRGRLTLRTGPVTRNFDNLILTNGVWNEIAVIVSNNVIRLGLCNELLGQGESTKGESAGRGGRWLWETSVFDEDMRFAIGKDKITFSRTMDSESYPTSVRGDYHLFGYWNRALSDGEVYEAFSAGHTSVLDVGFNCDAAHEVFCEDSEEDVTILSPRPWNWCRLPRKLTLGQAVRLGFVVQPWHVGLPQVVRIACDSESGVGGKVLVSVDETSLGEVMLQPGKIDASIYLPADILTQGSHVIAVRRTDDLQGVLAIDGISIEGSWRVGEADNVALGSYETSDGGSVPSCYDWRDGNNWDAAGFTRNNCYSSVGGVRYSFCIPSELFQLRYRYRLTYKFGTGSSYPAGQPKPVYFVLNGVTNNLTHTSTGAKSDMTAEQTITLDPNCLRPGVNTFGFFDNRQVFSSPEQEKPDNMWTIVDYFRLKVIPPPKGMFLILR